MQPASAAAGSESIIGRYDLHVHTTMSDGSLELAEVLAIARGLGVTLGISDHVSARNVDAFVSSADKLERYLREIEAAPVFRAAELCWCDSFSESLTPELRGRFDYLIGSNHGFRLPNGSFGSPWWKALPPEWESNPGELMDLMVDNLCALIATMPIAIVAHPTLTPPALFSLEPDVHGWWTEEREDRLVEAAVGAGVALEISNRYRLPHDRLLAKALSAGATFSLGSDGHERHQVARLEWAVETARRVGITDEKMFVPEKV